MMISAPTTDRDTLTGVGSTVTRESEIIRNTSLPFAQAELLLTGS
jgi:hypothetical protein